MMLIIRWFFVSVLTCFSGLAAYASEYTRPEQLTFCYENQDYLPFVRHIPDGSVSKGQNGVLPDLIIATAEQLGISIRFVSKPWKRCQVLLKAGEVDSIFAVIWQPEREAWGVFPKRSGQPDERYRLWRVDYKIYTRKDTELSWDGVRFSGVKMGLSAPLGYVAEKKLEQLGVNSKTNFLPAEGLKLVSKMRLDGYVLESSIGDYLVQSEGVRDEVAPLPHPFFYADWYLPFSHKLFNRYPQVVKRFWHELGNVRERHGESFKAHYRQY